MAAMRSALALLSRRSCDPCGSPAAASMGGRGLEIHQVFRPGAPRTPPLRPASVRNLESRRGLSTGGGEPPVKTESVLTHWWQRASNRVKNASEEEKTRAHFVYSLFTVGTASVYAVKTTVDLYDTIINRDR